MNIEDPDMSLDLGVLNSGQNTQYNKFWDEIQKLPEEDVGLAVEERRYSEVTRLARVICMIDLLDEVSACSLTT